MTVHAQQRFQTAGDRAIRLHPDDRVALFIDGANFFSATRALGIDVDYRRLLDHFSARCRLRRAFYYTVLFEGEDYTPIRPLVDWLDYNGFTVISKTAREITEGAVRKRPRDMNIELACDMMDMAESLDHAVLFSGDGDFSPLVAAMQRRDVRVTVVSTLRSSACTVSDELRRQADGFCDLADLAPVLARTKP